MSGFSNPPIVINAPITMGGYTAEQIGAIVAEAIVAGQFLSDPTTAVGDIIFRTADGLARLPLGTVRQHLAVGEEGLVYVDATAGPGGGGLVSVEADTSPKLGGSLAGNGHQIREAMGTSVASANELPILADGNCYAVTGTTTISSITTMGVGTRVTLHFEEPLTLVHSANAIVLPTGSSIAVEGGDIATFREFYPGRWICEAYLRASGEALLGGGGGSSLYSERSYDVSPSIYDGTFILATTGMTLTHINASIASGGSGTPRIGVSWDGFDRAELSLPTEAPNGAKYGSADLSGLSVPAGQIISISLLDSGEYMGSGAAYGSLVVGLEWTRTA